MSAGPRIPREAAEAALGPILATLRAIPKTVDVTVCGSIRRRAPDVGDVDVLVCHPSIKAMTEIRAALVAAGYVLVGDGDEKISTVVALIDGVPLSMDLRRCAPHTRGAALIHMTGPTAHNVRLRTIARRRGFLLNEKGLHPLRPIADQDRPSAATEDAIYLALGMFTVEPELRT